MYKQYLEFVKSEEEKKCSKKLKDQNQIPKFFTWPAPRCIVLYAARGIYCGSKGSKEKVIERVL